MESISENNGLNFLTESDQLVYSVGISTGGTAEIRMVQNHQHRHVIASTIDSDGVLFAKKQIEQLGLSHRIDVKIEDVTLKFPYLPAYFDYIYARLVLHYLPKKKLQIALQELNRILKIGGKLFVVVRSTDCPEASGENAQYDEETGLTTYISSIKSYSRYFHTCESIQNYLAQAGFAIKHTATYQERLCIDFQRSQPAKYIDHLIEVLAVKE